MSKKGTYWLVGIATFLLLVATTIFILRKSKRFTCDSSMLFVGDSHTAGSWSYADKIMSFCKSGKSKKIAEVGAPTTWIRSELEKELAKNSYDLIFILGGSNDIFGSLSTTKAKQNMEAMLDLAESKGSKVVVINPPSKKFYSGATDKHWELIRDWSAYLKTHKKPVSFVDFEALTQDQSVFAGDNIHVNSKGHEKLSNQVISKLNLA